jgi:spore germination cell wall hydrolase CwlJ-like protein
MGYKSKSVIVWVFTAVSMFLCGSCFANNDLVKIRMVNAIIGEAEGEPYEGKLAVACAIRNRGTLRGVYGEKSHRVLNHKYSHKTFIDAVRAYEESASPINCKFIDGADHWEGTSFKQPAWAKNMITTATIGKQKFYRKDYK